MFRIDRKSLAEETAKRWREQYPERRCDGDKEAIYHKLLALGPSPDPEQVDQVIGNGSWTRVPECSECAATSEFVIQVGQEPDYESSTAWLCGACIAKAHKLSQ